MATAAGAAVGAEFASPFSSHMVLQRGMKVPVWGNGEPGEKVTVSFADQKLTATANAKGRWWVGLKPMEASCEGRELTLVFAKGKTTLEDVVVGEVWLCAGQSNMGVPMCGGSPRYRDRQGALIAQMTHRPMLRYAMTPSGKWDFEQYDTTGSKIAWQMATAENLMSGCSFSAVAIYFGLDLEAELRIPVGLVGVYRGATGIDSWTPREGTLTRPDLKDVAEWQFIPADKWTKACAKGAIDQPDMQPSVYFNTIVAPWVPFACRGIIWYQGEHESVSEPHRYCSKLHALFDGWKLKFGNPKLKFYYVQIPTYGVNVAPMQEAMAQFEREEPAAAMAVVTDVGNPRDVHPNEKALVGHRLALHALKRDYGFEKIRDNSPTPESWRAVGDTFEVTFRDAKNLYIYDLDFKYEKNPEVDTQFELAGADGVWKPAKFVNLEASRAWSLDPNVYNKEYKGTFEGGNKLVLKAAGVSAPKKLRYLHCRPWVGNIFNEVNLPLGAFTIGD